MPKNTSTATSPTSLPVTVAAPALPATYEQAVQELEALVAGLDAGTLPLDELLTHYQRGAQLLAFCRERLQSVENQIKVLDGGEWTTWNNA